ncbi:MAG: hypothetical protein KDC34_00440 [Saprospiraceae bacterium]|nr:hypothetical protein [Saprospiraceae bacterium]
MSVFVEFDESGRPLVTATFSNQKLTPELFNNYLKGVEQLWEKDERYLLILDMRNIRVPKYRYIRQQANWLKQHEAEILTYCRGITCVVNRPLIRYLVRLVFMLQASPVHYVVYSNMQEAVQNAKISLGLNQAQEVEL